MKFEVLHFWKSPGSSLFYLAPTPSPTKYTKTYKNWAVALTQLCWTSLQVRIETKRDFIWYEKCLPFQAQAKVHMPHWSSHQAQSGPNFWFWLCCTTRKQFSSTISAESGLGENFNTLNVAKFIIKLHQIFALFQFGMLNLHSILDRFKSLANISWNQECIGTQIPFHNYSVPIAFQYTIDYTRYLLIFWTYPRLNAGSTREILRVQRSDTIS